jgi:outer membrane protein assembly factor BamA
MFPRFGTLVLIASQVFLVQSSAQSSTCPDGLPSQQKPEIRVIVDAVEFHGENSVSEAERAVLAEDIKKTDFVTSSATHDEWAYEVAEVAIRGAFQDQGYFKVFAQGTPHLVRAEEYELHYVLRLDIESGPQYRLGNVRFKNNQDGPLVFGEAVLRQQLQLKSGDLFSVTRIREALEGLTKLYNARGYIDMVPEPETDITKVIRASTSRSRLTKEAPTESARLRFSPLSVPLLTCHNCLNRGEMFLAKAFGPNSSRMGHSNR